MFISFTAFSAYAHKLAEKLDEPAAQVERTLYLALVRNGTRVIPTK
ncbi:MAG: hypothetical protein ACHQU0_02720 [Candidatus Paceibacteria bacterium]